MRKDPDVAVASTTKQPHGSVSRFLGAATSLLSAAKALLINAGFICAIIFISKVVFFDNDSQALQFEEVSVTRDLVEMGYSGQIASARLRDAVIQINDAANTTKGRAELMVDSRQVDVIEPIKGVSIGSLRQLVRELFGFSQNRVAGEFLCADRDCNLEKVELHLRVINGGKLYPINVGAIGHLSGDSDLGQYFHRAGMDLLRIVDPYVVAAYLYAEDRVAAEGEARRIVRSRHPDSTWAANLLGMILKERYNSAEESQRWFQRSTELAERNNLQESGELYRNFGLSLGEREFYDQAIEMYQRAVEVDSDDAAAQLGWGNQLVALNRIEDAILHYEIALKIDPDYVVAYNNVGNALRELQRFDEATEKYQEAIEIDPDYAVAYDSWGNLLSMQGRFDEAIAKFELAVEKVPQFAEAFVSWGRLLFSRGRFQDAVEKFEAAYDLDSKYVELESLALALGETSSEDCRFFLSHFWEFSDAADSIGYQAMYSGFQDTIAHCEEEIGIISDSEE